MQISLTLFLLFWKYQHLDLKKAVNALPSLWRSSENVSAPAVLPCVEEFLERTDVTGMTCWGKCPVLNQPRARYFQHVCDL